jgi:pimeloyl-ACP methyl ester carboxylesterase
LRWTGCASDLSPPVRVNHRCCSSIFRHLIDVLELERASLVDLSLEGGAGLGFALRWPRRVDKLVLVDSYGLGSDVPWARPGYVLVHAPLINDLTCWLRRRSRRMVLPNLYGLVHEHRGDRGDGRGSVPADQ